MKTILFVYHVSSIGGGSYCLLSILKSFPRDKYKPLVLLAGDGPLVREIEKLGIEVLFLEGLTLWPYNQSLFNYLTLRQIYNLTKSLKKFEQLLMKRTDIDAVYMNTFMLAPYLKTAKEHGRKTVIHIREHWPQDEHVKQLAWMKKKILLYADEVVAINKYSASLSPKECTIVYDWIDFSERYKEMPMDKILGESSAGKKVFLYTGGLQRIKGTKEVVSVFSKYITDKDARLLMLGVDPKIRMDNIKSRIKYCLYKLGVNFNELNVKHLIAQDNRIRCIPGIYEIKHIIQQSYCSLSYFTIPHANLALAECITLGLPCVAAKSEESLEYSNDGELAVLYEMGSLNSFVAAINDLSCNYGDMKKSIKTHMHVIEQLFDSDRNIANLKSVYNKLLNDR